MNLQNPNCRALAFSLTWLGAFCIGYGNAEPDARSSRNWEDYGGSPDHSKYVDLTQITKENVKQLEVAWNYPSGDDNQYMFNPIVVDGVMYLMGKNNSLIALDAATGKEIWIHANLKGIIKRGINYWESKDRKDRRLIFSINDRLQAIDAATGQSILTFGDKGSVSMRDGLERDPATISRVQSTTPGHIFENLILVGSSPGENIFSAPGHLRAYDVVTGRLAWTFHTIPLPGEYGYDTWPKDAYKYVGGTNTWGEISVDEKRGIAYFPVGSPTYDYYGADRIGANLFGDCLLALDARTGKRLWHFQTTHHDLWDYDPTAAPQLITVQHNGKAVDAVAQATKQGFVFVFDRVTGEPLWPIEERPVPPSEMPGEQAWPTQPFPTVVPPFTRQNVTVDDINPYLPAGERELWRKRILADRTGLFQPPSDKYETIAMPGAVGGANFGNTASDPARGILYVSSQDYPSVYKLTNNADDLAPVSTDRLAHGEATYKMTCLACHGADRKGAVGPTLIGIGNKIGPSDFKTLLAQGKGQMPAFPHLDEKSVKDLFVFLGGNPAARERMGKEEPMGPPKPPGGPVVASGGAVVADWSPKGKRPDNYPPGVAAPKDRYTSDYGLQYPNLLKPPWSYIMAYDLNKGTLKWKKPLGQDIRISKLGGKDTGVPVGSQRKGMIVTSTGLLFATSKGGKIHAFDAENGDLLWSANLSHETEGLPAMYEADGRQYLIVGMMAPFSKESADRSKDPGALPPGYVVFSLPQKDKPSAK